jgi:hypothetical protein
MVNENHLQNATTAALFLMQVARSIILPFHKNYVSQLSELRDIDTSKHSILPY